MDEGATLFAAMGRTAGHGAAVGLAVWRPANASAAGGRPLPTYERVWAMTVAQPARSGTASTLATQLHAGDVVQLQCRIESRGRLDVSGALRGGLGVDDDRCLACVQLTVCVLAPPPRRPQQCGPQGLLCRYLWFYPARAMRRTTFIEPPAAAQAVPFGLRRNAAAGVSPWMLLDDEP